jgi:alkylhydroperoxidase/carboxymuconolactone decarboxylase family protein YurZ
VGATEAEIAETLGVAFVMGGTPALVTGANAFRK